MSDNELLLALSDMMDEKLKPVNDRLKKIELTQENDILPRLKKIELTQENDILPQIKKIELTQENDILPRLKKIELTQENNILPQIKKIELTQENDIIPRLQNVEARSMSINQRYQSDIEKIDSMQDELDIIKKIVAEYSGKRPQFA